MRGRPSCDRRVPCTTNSNFTRRLTYKYHRHRALAQDGFTGAQNRRRDQAADIWRRGYRKAHNHLSCSSTNLCIHVSILYIINTQTTIRDGLLAHAGSCRVVVNNSNGTASRETTNAPIHVMTSQRTAASSH